MPFLPKLEAKLNPSGLMFVLTGILSAELFSTNEAIWPFEDDVLLAIPILGVGLAAYATGLLTGLVGLAVAALYAAYFAATPTLHAAGASSWGHELAALALAWVATIMIGVVIRRRDGEAAARLANERAQASELARMNERLLSANRDLEAFTYVVSHDLKEPVRAIRARLDAIQEDYGPTLAADAQDNLAHARVAADRLSDLMLGLLELGRLTRLEPAKVEPVAVGAVLAGAAFRARVDPLLRERRATLEDETGGAPRVLATPDALAQVLGNLAVNAIRHNVAPEPRVRVRASARGGRVDLVVEDNGAGFPPGARHPPAGFGLIIVRRAVEQMGGELALDRSELGGVAAHVILRAAA